MRFVSRMLALVSLNVALLAPSACHTARAADPPRSPTPTIDVEIEDRAPDKSSHVSRFSLSILDGNAEVKARDGDASYVVEAHAVPTAEPHFMLKLKRAGRGNGDDLDLWSAIPLRAGPRLVMAKIDRADGHLTSVVAQVR